MDNQREELSAKLSSSEKSLIVVSISFIYASILYFVFFYTQGADIVYATLSTIPVALLVVIVVRIDKGKKQFWFSYFHVFQVFTLGFILSKDENYSNVIDNLIICAIYLLVVLFILTVDYYICKIKLKVLVVLFKISEFNLMIIGFILAAAAIMFGVTITGI